ncbi:MAG: hypothetical protein J5I90_05885 [Caldilineales bacterium]|nr:hypothetical protein [Caldilineales bacterium]
MKRSLLPILFAGLLVLAACGNRDIEPTLPPPTQTPVPRAANTTAPTDLPAPTDVPAATDTPIPTVEPASPTPVAPADDPAPAPPPQAESPLPEPTPEAVPVDWSQTESRTPDGFYVRGDPQATILILDYSDFL